MGNMNKIDKLVLEYRETNDRNLLNDIVEKTEKLSFKIAHKYKINIDDIKYHYGVALMKAIKKWDKDKGVLFSSYLITVLMNELKMEWRKKQDKFEREICLYANFFNDEFIYDEDSIVYDILLNDTINKTIKKSNMKKAIKMFIDDIKVNDIIEKSKVKRTTFYNNLNIFKDTMKKEVEEYEIYF